jgi:hypothetical protein
VPAQIQRTAEAELEYDAVHDLRRFARAQPKTCCRELIVRLQSKRI